MRFSLIWREALPPDPCKSRWSAWFREWRMSRSCGRQHNAKWGCISCQTPSWYRQRYLSRCWTSPRPHWHSRWHLAASLRSYQRAWLRLFFLQLTSYKIIVHLNDFYPLLYLIKLFNLPLSLYLTSLYYIFNDSWNNNWLGSSTPILLLIRLLSPSAYKIFSKLISLSLKDPYFCRIFKKC